jgi:hypothetical protein
MEWAQGVPVQEAARGGVETKMRPLTVQEQAIAIQVANLALAEGQLNAKTNGRS